MQAGRVVHGDFGIEDDEISVDVSLLDVSDVSLPERGRSDSDVLRALFEMEARLVFALLEEMGIEPTPEERERIRRVPTESLQAFLAYSRGLEREDAGDFEGAATYFEQAIELDSGFDTAREHAEASRALSTAWGDCRRGPGTDGGTGRSSGSGDGIAGQPSRQS